MGSLRYVTESCFFSQTYFKYLRIVVWISSNIAGNSVFLSVVDIVEIKIIRKCPIRVGFRKQNSHRK